MAKTIEVGTQEDLDAVIATQERDSRIVILLAGDARFVVAGSSPPRPDGRRRQVYLIVELL